MYYVNKKNETKENRKLPIQICIHFLDLLDIFLGACAYLLGGGAPNGTIRRNNILSRGLFPEAIEVRSIKVFLVFVFNSNIPNSTTIHIDHFCYYFFMQKSNVELKCPKFVDWFFSEYLKSIDKI